MSEEKQEQIVKKGTPEFKVVSAQYLKLFFDSKQEEYIGKGQFSQGENKGTFLGMTSKKILETNLPKPFGCSNLFIQPCFDNADGKSPNELNKLTGVIWFCGIDGSICVCCREDFSESYPDYCKPKYEPDDCTVHQGNCDECPSRYNCHPELDESNPEDYEVEEWNGGW